MPDVSQTTKRAPLPCTDVTILIAYEGGRQDTFEEAASMLEMSDATIRLHCGEMTAQEMRSVKAVLKWKSGAMRKAATDASDSDTTDYAARIRATPLELLDVIWTADMHLSHGFVDAARDLLSKTYIENTMPTEEEEFERYNGDQKDAENV